MHPGSFYSDYVQLLSVVFCKVIHYQGSLIGGKLRTFGNHPVYDRFPFCSSQLFVRCTGKLMADRAALLKEGCAIKDGSIIG